MCPQCLDLFWGWSFSFRQGSPINQSWCISLPRVVPYQGFKGSRALHTQRDSVVYAWTLSLMDSHFVHPYTSVSRRKIPEDLDRIAHSEHMLHQVYPREWAPLPWMQELQATLKQLFNNCKQTKPVILNPSVVSLDSVIIAFWAGVKPWRAWTDLSQSSRYRRKSWHNHCSVYNPVYIYI